MDNPEKVNPNLREYGDNLIALGEALKNPGSTLPMLSNLAFECGLGISFSFTFLENNDSTEDA